MNIKGKSLQAWETWLKSEIHEPQVDRVTVYVLEAFLKAIHLLQKAEK